MLPGSDDDLPETASGEMFLDDVLLPPDTKTGKTASKFAPKLGCKTKKPLAPTSKPPDAPRPITSNAKQEISMTDQGSSGREVDVLLGMESLDNCVRTSSATGFAETIDASNLSSSGSAPMNCSFQINEIPDAAETAPVRPLSEVLADDLEGAEPSFTETMNEELANKTSHSVSTVSDNVDFQPDHGSLRNVDLADISGLESFGSILSEPDSATGQTVPKFRPKMSTRSKASKLESFSNTNVAQESTSLGDSLPLDTEQLEGHNPCIPPDSSTNMANEQENHVEIGSPGGDDEFETIDIPTDGYTPWNEEEQTQQILDDQIASKSSEVHGADKSSRKSRKRIAVDSTSENLDCGIGENRDVENSNDDDEFETIDMPTDGYTPWNDEEPTQEILDDQIASKSSEVHGTDKSSRKLRKRIAVDSTSENLDCGISENRGVENSNDLQKETKRSKRQTIDSQKPKRRTKASKEPDSTKTEPPKKRFPHGTRRKRRQVDKVLLETPDDELDRRQLAFRDLIMLAEAKERIASKEAANLNDTPSNTGSFSNGSRYDPDNPYDEELDPDGEEAHRNMLRNSRKINYQTYMNKEKPGRWSKSETALFYEAIRQFGTDFEMILQLFPNRTRNQVKSKFKTEERKHPSQVQDAMMHRSEDHSHFERVIQQLQTKAEEEDSRFDNVNDDPAMVSEDAANANQCGNQEERGEAGKEEMGEAGNSEKREEGDDGCASLDLDEYETCDWDTGTSFQNEEKHSEYDDLIL